MPARVLAVLEYSPVGLDPRAAAAASLALRFASDSRGQADALLVGGSAVRGAWARSWSTTVASVSGLVGAVERLLLETPYEAVLVSDTPGGRELAGRLAARRGLPAVGAALLLRSREGMLEVVRPAAAGSRTAVLAVAGSPLIAVVDADAGSPIADGAAVAVSPLALDAGAGVEAIRLLSEERLAPWDMDLTEADVIVAGGRGVGSRAGFDLLSELAALLGGTVGASRVAVDFGWVPYSRQVGLTGRAVSPRLYIACGISGAIHHTLGMREASFIVAINSDPRAPIFSIADVSIVGDIYEVLPDLIRELKGRSAGRARETIMAGRGA